MLCKPIIPDPELTKRIKESVETVNKMTPEEREELHKKQRESWVRAEKDWPDTARLIK